MPANITKKTVNTFSLVITVAAVVVSSGLWLAGFLSSPLMHTGDKGSQKYSRNLPATDPLENQAEKKLAEAYWQRYPDVRQSAYWGPEGPLGIRGPRDHYDHYGRQEGRIFTVTQP